MFVKRDEVFETNRTGEKYLAGLFIFIIYVFITYVFITYVFITYVFITYVAW